MITRDTISQIENPCILYDFRYCAKAEILIDHQHIYIKPYTHIQTHDFDFFSFLLKGLPKLPQQVQAQLMTRIRFCFNLSILNVSWIG